MEPFQLCIDAALLADLRARLQRTRWPDEAPDAPPWHFGTDLAYLKTLVAYWADGYDWRAAEAKLNAWPQYTQTIDGIRVHFLHVPGEGADPLPLVLAHGWPGSIVEFHKLIPLLTRGPESFTLVVPSLPGYTLSFTPGQRRVNHFGIADIFDELMAGTLGYRRYAAQGGDWGSFISAALGLNHADHVLGIHLNLLPLARDRDYALPDTPDVRAYRQELANWLTFETGYSTIQGTRPQTLAYALTDSPVGLAAWILEKFRVWSDHDGDLERVFTRDELLTNIMLYWVSGAIGSSFYPYYARHHEGWPLPGPRTVDVPMGYCGFPKDILHPPRALAERAFTNIQRWTVMPRGGHFAALEAPDALAADIRAFFRPLRGS